MAGLVHVGGAALDELASHAWAALRSDDSEGPRDAPLHRGALRHCGGGSSDGGVLLRPSAVGALAAALDPCGFTGALPVAEAAAADDENDGTEVGFSVTFGDGDGENEEGSSTDSEKDDDGAVSSEELAEGQLLARTRSAAARRALAALALDPSPLLPSSSYAPTLPADALRAACAAVVASEGAEPASSAACMALEAAAEICHAAALAAGTVHAAVATASAHAAAHAAADEATAQSAALHRSAATASAARRACLAAATAAEELYAYGSASFDLTATEATFSITVAGGGVAAATAAAALLGQALAEAVAVGGAAKALELDAHGAAREASAAEASAAARRSEDAAARAFLASGAGQVIKRSVMFSECAFQFIILLHPL